MARECMGCWKRNYKLGVGLGMPTERDSDSTDTRVEEAEETLQQLQRRYDQCEELASTLLEEKREEEQEDMTFRVMDTAMKAQKEQRQREEQESRYQVLVEEKENSEAQLRGKEEQVLE